MTYLIAEIGVNHNGDMTIAQDLIEQAAKAGFDAVKFQSFHAEELAAARAPFATYQRDNLASQKNQKYSDQRAMLKALELSEEQATWLKSVADSNSIDFISTAFGSKAHRFLVASLNLKTFKMPSGEITNLPFLLEVARSNGKIILSTGMSSLGDIETALAVIAWGGQNAGTAHPDTLDALAGWREDEACLEHMRQRVTILHCTSQYPAPDISLNLRAIKTLRRAFGLPVGYSDHSLGFEAAVAAVALGAVMVEKHITFDTDAPGPDHKASLPVDQADAFVASVRRTENMLGRPEKAVTAAEAQTRSVARKSIHAGKAITKGTPFTKDNICLQRPADGAPAERYWEYLGRCSDRDYEQGDPIA